MPSPVRIDFAGKPVAAPRVGAALLVAGLLAGVLAIAGQLHLQRELEQVEARIERLARQIDPKAAARERRDPAAERALRTRIEASNRVLDALDRPWIRLFDDLEAAGVEGVALLALEPDASKEHVRIAGEARDRDTLSRYLERLGRLDSLREVRLNQHELRVGTDGGALRFTVSARWVRPA
jgi:Tfp pilus assembly protein PilN